MTWVYLTSRVLFIVTYVALSEKASCQTLDGFCKNLFQAVVWNYFSRMPVHMDVSENSGTPNGLFIMETLLRWMIWRYHYFRKHPYQSMLPPRWHWHDKFFRQRGIVVAEIQQPWRALNWFLLLGHLQQWIGLAPFTKMKSFFGTHFYRVFLGNTPQNIPGN